MVECQMTYVLVNIVENLNISHDISVTNSRAKPQQTPSMEKHALPPRVVYCAINPTLTDSQSLEFEICIFPREAIPSHYFPLREDSSRVLAWGLHG